MHLSILKSAFISLSLCGHFAYMAFEGEVILLKFDFLYAVELH